MYGYIRSYKFELKYKDSIIYNKLYCAICNILKDNIGTKGRFLTSYDAVLFLAIFDSVSTNKTIYELGCPLNPLKKGKIEISKEALEYTSFLSVFYTYAKIKDNIIDENKNFYKRREYRFNKHKKIQSLLHYNEEIFILLDRILKEYFIIESEKKSFDELSNKMGELFGEAFKGYNSLIFEKDMNDTLYNIGFNLGKWIYIVDAFDDLDRDIKDNCFNPILQMEDYSTISFRDLQKKIVFICSCLTKSIINEANIFKTSNYYPVIENIIVYGMDNSVRKIIKKKKRNKN